MSQASITVIVSLCGLGFRSRPPSCQFAASIHITSKLTQHPIRPGYSAGQEVIWQHSGVYTETGDTVLISAASCDQRCLSEMSVCFQALLSFFGLFHDIIGRKGWKNETKKKPPSQMWDTWQKHSAMILLFSEGLNMTDVNLIYFSSSPMQVFFVIIILLYTA